MVWGKLSFSQNSWLSGCQSVCQVCGKKGPKVLGAPQDEATAWRNGANFLDCTFQPLLRLFSQVDVSIISKRMKNTQHEKTANALFTKLCTPRQHKQEDIFNFEKWFLVRTRKILLLKGFPIGIEKSSYWDTGLQFWEIKDVWRRERIWSAQTQFKIDIFPGKWTTQESLLITLARVGGKYLGWGGTANKDEGSGALAGSSATQSWPLHSFYCQAYWILNGHQCHIDWTYVYILWVTKGQYALLDEQLNIYSTQSDLLWTNKDKYFVSLILNGQDDFAMQMYVKKSWFHLSHLQLNLLSFWIVWETESILR